MASVLTRSGVINYATLSSTFEYRELLRNYLDVVQDDMGFFDWLDFYGRAVPSGDIEFSNITEGSLFATAEVKTTGTAGSANTAKTVNILGTEYVPFVGQIILFPDGTNGRVQSVSADSADWNLSVMPMESGSNIPIVTDGDKLIVTSNAQGEGSTMTTPYGKPTATKRSNYIQLFTTYDEITDVAGSTVVEIPFNGKKYVLDKNMFQMYLKHRIEIENSFVTGVKGSRTDASGNSVWTNGGLDYSISNNGFSFTTASSGVYNVVTDTASLSVSMDTARCGSKYMLFAAQTLDNAIDTNSVTNTSLTGGGIGFADYNGADRIKLAMGVKDITFGGRTITKKRLKAFEHPQLLGTTGYSTWLKYGYLIPEDKVKTKDQGTVDRMRLRYQVFNGDEDLRYLEVEGGALSNKNQDFDRKLKKGVMSNQGLEFAGIEQFGKVILKA